MSKVTQNVRYGNIDEGNFEQTTSGEERGNSLKCSERFSYSVGHVLNDLTASVWFTYMLIYLQDVVGFGSAMAGNIMLVGQVADAVFNPLIGFVSDRDRNTCIKRCGRRRRWHAIGSVVVAVSFPLMLYTCPWCVSEASIWSRLLFYIPIVIFFQFGWASTQIAHLALIPELTPSDKGRLELNALRYGWTVISNIIVYAVAWGLFGVDQNTTQKVGPEDKNKFEILGLVIVGLGIFACILFYIGTSDPSAINSNDNQDYGASHRRTNRKKVISLLSTFKDIRFLWAALLYMSARVIVNLTQVYVPFFVTHTLDLDKYTIATYPLVTSIFSFITAASLKFVARKCSSKILYFWGALNVIGASLWMAFLEPHLEVATFGTAVLSGIGGAALVVTSLSIVSELIGTNTENGAFVYGIMGFADKLCNGIGVFAIQSGNPCEVGASDDICMNYIRYIISLVPGGVAAFSMLILAIMSLQKEKGFACTRKLVTNQAISESSSGPSKITAAQSEDTKAPVQPLPIIAPRLMDGPISNASIDTDYALRPLVSDGVPNNIHKIPRNGSLTTTPTKWDSWIESLRKQESRITYMAF